MQCHNQQEDYKMALFDLNIEKVLDNWTVSDALREIISNALDEKTLTGTRDISIQKDENGRWHIRDFGRGLQSSHFTQNENPEKQTSNDVIGEFGVGLKDALGVVFNHSIHVAIDSRYGHVTLTMAKKEGFDIKTLHADFTSPLNPDMEGTDFTFEGLDDEDVRKAKNMFLIFNQETILETTPYGQVLRRSGNGNSKIYINGVRVAIETNFLYSYNITEITGKIRKALNRERSNVGRGAYTDSVKKILLACESDEVNCGLMMDLLNFTSGTSHDESGWKEIATHTALKLNQSQNVVFVSPQEQASYSKEQKELLKESGKRIVMIPSAILESVDHEVSTYSDVLKDFNSSFHYSFVEEGSLTTKEKEVYGLAGKIKEVFRRLQYPVDISVKISNSIRSNDPSSTCVYDPDENAIIIKRTVLKSRLEFCTALTNCLAFYQQNVNAHNYEPCDLEEILKTMLEEVTLECISGISIV